MSSGGAVAFSAGLLRFGILPLLRKPVDIGSGKGVQRVQMPQNTLKFGNCCDITCFIDHERKRPSTHLAIIVNLATVVLGCHHGNGKPLTAGRTLDLVVIHRGESRLRRKNPQPFLSQPRNRYPTPRTVSINSLPPSIFLRSMCTC